LLKNEGGYQNLFAMILTAILMTSFELGFIWINYYMAFNNMGKNIIDKLADSVTEEVTNEYPEQSKKAGGILETINSFMFGMSSADIKKVDIINTFANTAGLLLVFILILILLIVKAKGEGKCYKLPPRIIFASLSTAVCLVVFFAFFYSSTTAAYKMLPNQFTGVDSIINVLETDNLPSDDFPLNGLPTQYLGIIAGCLVFLYVITKYKGFGIYNKITGICKPGEDCRREIYTARYNAVSE